MLSFFLFSIWFSYIELHRTNKSTGIFMLLTKIRCQLVMSPGFFPHCFSWTRGLLEGLFATFLSAGWSAAMPDLRGWPKEPQARAKLVLKTRRSHSPDHPTPKSFKCLPDFERHCSSRGDAGVCLSWRSLGDSNVPLPARGGGNRCISPGVTWRLSLQERGHSWSPMVLWMWRGGVHLTSSCLMHHT